MLYTVRVAELKPLSYGFLTRLSDVSLARIAEFLRDAVGSPRKTRLAGASPRDPLTDQALVTFRLRANTASVHETAAHVTDHPANRNPATGRLARLWRSVARVRARQSACR